MDLIEQIRRKVNLLAEELECIKYGTCGSKLKTYLSNKFKSPKRTLVSDNTTSLIFDREVFETDENKEGELEITIKGEALKKYAVEIFGLTPTNVTYKNSDSEYVPFQKDTLYYWDIGPTTKKIFFLSSQTNEVEALSASTLDEVLRSGNTSSEAMTVGSLSATHLNTIYIVASSSISALDFFAGNGVNGKNLRAYETVTGKNGYFIDTVETPKVTTKKLNFTEITDNNLDFTYNKKLVVNQMTGEVGFKDNVEGTSMNITIPDNLQIQNQPSTLTVNYENPAYPLPITSELQAIKDFRMILRNANFTSVTDANIKVVTKDNQVRMKSEKGTVNTYLIIGPSDSTLSASAVVDINLPTDKNWSFSFSTKGLIKDVNDACAIGFSRGQSDFSLLTSAGFGALSTSGASNGYMLYLSTFEGLSGASEYLVSYTKVGDILNISIGGSSTIFTKNIDAQTFLGHYNFCFAVQSLGTGSTTYTPHVSNLKYYIQP